jgi:hypothetical protein
MSNLSTSFGNSAQNVYNNMGTNTGNALLTGASAYQNGLSGAANQFGRWYQSQNNPSGVNPQYGLPNYAIDPYGGG